MFFLKAFEGHSKVSAREYYPFHFLGGGAACTPRRHGWRADLKREYACKRRILACRVANLEDDQAKSDKPNSQRGTFETKLRSAREASMLAPERLLHDGLTHYRRGRE